MQLTGAVTRDMAPSPASAPPHAGFTPEFALALACCRWPPSPERGRAVLAAAAAVDWPLFVRVAKRQRVEGLTWHALRQAGVEVPDEQAESLAAAAQRIARENLGNLAECLRLRARLEEAGVPPLFVKGLTLASIAYGDLAVKSGWDIDVLIPGQRLAAAIDVLEREGYRLVIPAPEAGRARIHWWHERWKESVWSNDGRGTHVELHTRLVDNIMLLKGLGGAPARREVEIARGLFLPTLRPEELFAYLCVHGAASGWFRLKWAADVGALLRGCEEAETERLYRASQRLGAGRAAAQALLLCASLFGTRIAAALLHELGADSMNGHLFRLALKNMAGRSVATEVTELRFGTLGIHLNQLAILPGWRFKLAEAWRQLANPEHRLATRLPPPFHLLSPLLVRLRSGRA